MKRMMWKQFFFFFSLSDFRQIKEMLEVFFLWWREVMLYEGGPKDAPAAPFKSPT